VRGRCRRQGCSLRFGDGIEGGPPAQMGATMQGAPETMSTAPEVTFRHPAATTREALDIDVTICGFSAKFLFVRWMSRNSGRAPGMPDRWSTIAAGGDGRGPFSNGPRP